MAFAVTSQSLPASWKRDLTGRPQRSMAFYMALLLNGSCLLELAETTRTYKASLKLRPDLVGLFAITAIFLGIAAFSMWQIYREARTDMSIQEAPSMLVISYIAFGFIFSYWV